MSKYKERSLDQCKQKFDLQIFVLLLTLMHDHGLWVGYKGQTLEIVQVSIF